MLVSSAAYGMSGGHDKNEVANTPESPQTICRNRLVDVKNRVAKYQAFLSDPQVPLTRWVQGQKDLLQLEARISEMELQLEALEKVANKK